MSPIYQPPPATGGSVATDTIWDTKGDLAIATGADAAAKLVIGSNTQVLTADSTQTTGVKWAAATAANFGDTVLCAAPTGVAATDNTNLQAGLTAAAGGTLQLRNGTYNITSAKTISSFTTVIGSKATVVSTNFTGTVFNLVGKLGVTFRDLYFNVLAASSTLVLLDGTFGCVFDNTQVWGTHSLGSPQPAQIAFDSVNNSGDNFLVGGTELGSLGIGFRTNSVFNYLSNMKITNCQYGVYGVNSYGAGIMADNCVFASTPGGTTISQVYIPNAGNRYFFTNCDMEGATNTVVVGSGTVFDGPTQFSMANCNLAGTTKILDIKSAYGCSLMGISFTADPSTTPTTLAVNATGAPDNGYAMGLVTNVAADSDTIAASIFPAAWTYFGRVDGKLGGAITTATQTASDYSTKLATTSYADSAVAKRARNQAWMPTGGISETMPRVNRTDAATVTSTGVLHLSGGLLIPANVTVTNITFVSAGTGAGTPTHWWFCLVDQSLNVLRKTADQTTTAWGANTAKTLALATTYTPTVDTPVYAGFLMTATTIPSLAGSVVSAAGGTTPALAPQISGQSTSGLTTPASLGATAAALGGGDLVYAYLS